MREPVEIKEVEEADDADLKALYMAHKGPFIAWFNKNSNSPAHLYAEWYQESFFLFLDNIKSKRLTALTSSITTYLIGIGKNLERDYFKAQERSRLALDKARPFITQDTNDNLDPELVERAMAALQKMDERCKRILIMRIYDNYTMEAIAARMGFKSEQVAKNAKSACLKKLQVLFHNL